MLAAMAMLEMDVAPPPSPVTAANSIEELLAYFMEAEAGFNAFGDFVVSNTPPTTGIISRTEVITGVDGNEINLYIHRPDGVDGPMPCIVHTHGGAMAILKASNPNYSRWRDDLAATGMVVVGVEFRNAAGELGPHPFPAGLNDCASAAQWVVANRVELGASKVVMSGESGAVATCRLPPH